MTDQLIGKLSAQVTADASQFTATMEKVSKDTREYDRAFDRLAKESLPKVSEAAKQASKKMGMAGMRMQQSVFLVDDAIAGFQTRGFKGMLQAGSNNLTMLATSFSPVLGALAVGGVAAASFGLSLYEAAKRAKEFKSELIDINAEFQKTARNRQRAFDSFMEEFGDTPKAMSVDGASKRVEAIASEKKDVVRAREDLEGELKLLQDKINDTAALNPGLKKNPYAKDLRDHEINFDVLDEEKRKELEGQLRERRRLQNDIAMQERMEDVLRKSAKSAKQELASAQLGRDSFDQAVSLFDQGKIEDAEKVLQTAVSHVTALMASLTDENPLTNQLSEQANDAASAFSELQKEITAAKEAALNQERSKRAFEIMENYAIEDQKDLEERQRNFEKAKSDAERDAKEKFYNPQIGGFRSVGASESGSASTHSLINRAINGNRNDQQQLIASVKAQEKALANLARTVDSLKSQFKVVP